MNDIKVSVIVPIYNAASNRRLARLLECLKSQTLQDIEFILVFDNPTDNSYDIAVQIAKGDKRFVFVENEVNLHIGYSRNKGIDASKGEFLAFADDDDIMKPDMYECLYFKAKESNADIVISPAIFNNQGQVSVEYFDYSANDKQQYWINHLVGSLTDKELEEDSYPYLWANGNMWNKIFKHSIITEYNIRFVNTRECCYEDILFQLNLFCKTSKITYEKEPFYTHIYYEDKSNTSQKGEYANDKNQCNFLSNLIESYFKDPQLISRKRIEKRVIDVLIEIVARGLKRRKFTETYRLLNSFNKSHLDYIINWYPYFLSNETLSVKRFYLIYIVLIKSYLKINYGKNSCGIC